MEQSESRELSEGRSEIRQEALPLVSCFWCGRIDSGEHPLSVCSACAERFSATRSLGMSGSHPLRDEAIDEVPTRTSPGNQAREYRDRDSFHVF